MKTILHIGNTLWACPDATVPAKIAELLGGLKPVDLEYPKNGEGNPVLHPFKDWGHELKIEELPSEKLLTAEQFKQWQLKTRAIPPKDN